MNYSRAFTAVFDDKNWISKILIAGLIALIPVIGQIYLLGWMVEIVRRVKAGREDILPATHFSYFLTLGLKVVVVGLIYSIPVLILSGIMQLITAGANNADADFFTVFFAGMGCVGGILGVVLNFAIGMLGTYGIIRIAETDQIKACLDFSDAFNCIKNNLSVFVIVELLSIVTGLIQSAGLIICIGIIFTVPYGMAVDAHLIGQLWNNLRSYPGKKDSVRGSVNEPKADDVVEEAPFRMVQDIENDVRETAAETAASAEEAAADVIDDVKDDLAEAAETVQEKAEDTVEAAADVVEDAKEDLAEAAETVQEKAEDAAETVTETSEQVQENITDILDGEAKSDTDNNDKDLPSFE